MLPDMNYEQKKKFWNFVYMDDFEFFYKFIADLSDEEQIRFFEETPDFVSDLLNVIYQRIMKEISQLSESDR